MSKSFTTQLHKDAEYVGVRHGHIAIAANMIVAANRIDKLEEQVAALTAERNNLIEWKRSAKAQLAKTDILHDALRGRKEYLGWDIHDAIVDALKQAELKIK